VAPRVLIDATDVPADRGALGRYVDGLIGALDVAGADLAVVCQRADEERYGRLAPSARVITGPTALSHRSARLAWEQSGLPVVAQQVNADVIHVPYYSMPLRPGRPTVVTVHDVTFFTEPELYSPVNAMFFKSAIRTAARRAARPPHLLGARPPPRGFPRHAGGTPLRSRRHCARHRRRTHPGVVGAPPAEPPP